MMTNRTAEKVIERAMWYVTFLTIVILVLFGAAAVFGVLLLVHMMIA